MITLNLQAENDCQQSIKDYLENNASEILAEKINNGVPVEKDGKTYINRKTLSMFWRYACERATKENKEYVANETVFGWAIHYFEENDIIGKLYNEDGTEYKPAPPPIQHKPYTPPVTPPVQKPIKPQISLFDYVDETEKKTDEPKEEQTQAETEITPEVTEQEEQAKISLDAVDETNETEEMPVEEELPDEQPEEECEYEFDRETGEIIGTKPIQPSIDEKYKTYIEYQKQHPKSLVAIRVGDFYEFLGENAVTVSDELGLTLIGRDIGLPARVPMVGIPHHASDSYFNKLVERYTVIVAENEQYATYRGCQKQEIIIDEQPEIEEIEVEETTEEQDEDFENERALSQFFDMDALCFLSELFDGKINIK